MPVVSSPVLNVEALISDLLTEWGDVSDLTTY